jgi:hypothetical protein
MANYAKLEVEDVIENVVARSKALFEGLSTNPHALINKQLPAVPALPPPKKVEYCTAPIKRINVASGEDVSWPTYEYE